MKRQAKGAKLTRPVYKRKGVDCKPGSVTVKVHGHFSCGLALCGRASCGLPGLKDGPSSPSLDGPLFGLASDGVCRAIQSPECWWALTPPFHPYPPRKGGGIFSVALSLGLLPVPVRDHPALRCPDFPRDRLPRPCVYPFLLPHLSQAYLQACFLLSGYILSQHAKVFA